MNILPDQNIIDYDRMVNFNESMSFLCRSSNRPSIAYIRYESYGVPSEKTNFTLLPSWFIEKSTLFYTSSFSVAPSHFDSDVAGIVSALSYQFLDSIQKNDLYGCIDCLKRQDALLFNKQVSTIIAHHYDAVKKKKIIGAGCMVAPNVVFYLDGVL